MAARLWNKAPFVRLLAALAGGIVLQRYLHLPLEPLLSAAGSGLALVLLFSFAPLNWRYRLTVANGLGVLLLMAAVGSMAVWAQDIRNSGRWFGHHYKTTDRVLITLEEPLVEKAASYKAIASVHALYRQKQKKDAEGRIILYIKKDSLKPALQYGSQILLSQALQPIKNAGNPGSFDYKTYNLFQGITHQVYLTKDDYVVLPSLQTEWFKTFIYNSRAWVVSTLKRFISGEKEQGLAEALLIGYKDDLDRNLVQAYSNTGVVHIIAISGLHLGLIYALLVFFTKPLKRVKKLLWLRLLLIVASLWLFSILAGGGPSVLRSALMFSLMALGEVALRKTTIFNTLSFSAFVLLCINPFWLWDVGFQLSYSAVLSIVLFFRPIYGWFHFYNKAVNFLWSLTAVTLSAQVLTLPISIYHFHQMPLLFLVTNFVAVPLSSLILLGEILLCAIFFFPALAGFAGSLMKELIRFMNSYIEGLNNLPFSTWNFLSVNMVQTGLLLFFVLAICYWLMEKQRRHGWIAFSAFALFLLIRSLSFLEAYQQRKLIVYNVPKHPAIDVVAGRTYAFIGDSSLLADGFERNFHLQPSRILHRMAMDTTSAGLKAFSLYGKHVLILDKAIPLAPTNPKPWVDVLVLSGNPKLYISKLLPALNLQQVVIDGSVPPWKAAFWKHDCDSLHIPCYNVSEEGAFVMNW